MSASSQSPKISIIIPVYNAEECLRQCLDSIASQTLSDIEAICVDDGSPDNSGAILDEYTLHDNRFKIIHQENKGVATARNVAIRHAKGDYIIFMDPDDFYPKTDTLETLYKVASDNKALICGGSFSVLKTNGDIVKKFDNPWHSGYAFTDSGWQRYEDYQFDFGYHRFLFSTKMLHDNGIIFPLFSRYQDPPFFVRAMICAKKFYHIPDVVYRYRDSNNTTIKWNTKKLTDRLNAAKNVMDIARQNNLQKLYGLTLNRVSAELHWIILTQFNEEAALEALAHFYETADFDFAFGTIGPFNINLMDSVNLYKNAQNKISKLERNLKIARQAQNIIENDLKITKSELKSIQHSTSWRSTKPLRDIGSAARKIIKR